MTINLQQDSKLEEVLSAAHYSYEKGLRAKAFFKTHSRMTSEDLVQITFMKTWAYLIRGGRVDVMRAFLYHVLDQLIIDEYRKHKMVSLDLFLEKGFDPISYDYERMSNISDGKSAFLLIQYLPKRYQQVMHLRYVQDLTLEEIAQRSGQSKNTVAVQVHRGLEKLRLLFGPP